MCDSSEFCLSVVVGKHTTNTLLVLCASYARRMYARIRTCACMTTKYSLRHMGGFSSTSHAVNNNCACTVPTRRGRTVFVFAIAVYGVK